MSHTSIKLILTATTFAFAAVLVLARPHVAKTEKLRRTLQEVANHTMCPIVIFYDKNEDRIPRVIKHLKCAETPNQLCTKTNHGCCKYRHHDNAKDVSFTTNCVEIEDMVLVTYKDSPTPQGMPVSVGCTCMMQEVTKAAEVR